MTFFSSAKKLHVPLELKFYMSTNVFDIFSDNYPRLINIAVEIIKHHISIIFLKYHGPNTEGFSQETIFLIFERGLNGKNNQHNGHSFLPIMITLHVASFACISC